MSNIHGLGDLRAKASASTTTMTVPPPASSATKESSVIPPATAPKGRIIKASMMSGASRLILSGGKFTNVGGAIYRTGPAGVAAPILPEAPLEEPEPETVMAVTLDNVSDLMATDGVEVENIGTELFAGQRPKKGQNIEVSLLEKVKDSEIKGGTYTNAATVIYVGAVAKEKV